MRRISATSPIAPTLISVFVFDYFCVSVSAAASPLMSKEIRIDETSMATNSPALLFSRKKHGQHLL